MRKRITLCKARHWDLVIFTELQTGKILIAYDSFPLLNLEIGGNTVNLDMVFSPLKNFALTVFYFCFVLFVCFFFLRFRRNIFPFPVEIFS